MLLWMLGLCVLNLIIIVVLWVPTFINLRRQEKNISSWGDGWNQGFSKGYQKGLAEVEYLKGLRCK